MSFKLHQTWIRPVQSSSFSHRRDSSLPIPGASILSYVLLQRPGFLVLSVPLICHLNRHLLNFKAVFRRKVDWVSWVSKGVQTFREAKGEKHIYQSSDLKGLKCQLELHTAALHLLARGHRVLCSSEA